MAALNGEDIFRAVERTHLRAEGYSVVCLITGWGVVASRPTWDKAPISRKEEVDGFTERLVSSESVVCQSIGFENDRDISPEKQ